MALAVSSAVVGRADLVDLIPPASPPQTLEPFEQCGAASRGRALIQRFLKGGGEPGEFNGELKLEPGLRLVPSMPERRYLYRLGERLGLQREETDALVTGLVDTESIVRLETPVEVGAYAAAAYLDGVARGARGERRAELSVEQFLREMKATLKEQRGAFPVSMQQLRQYSDPRDPFQGSAKNALVFAADGFNAAYVRMSLGREGSQFNLPLGLDQPGPGNGAGAIMEIPLISVPQVPTAPFHHAEVIGRFESPGAPGSTAAETAFMSAIRFVYSVLPPPEDDQLYTLALIAARAVENHTKPKEFAVALTGLKGGDIQVVEFLRHEVALPAPGQADRIRSFFELIGDRPYSFEDLTGAVALAKATLAIRQSPDGNAAVEVPVPSSSEFDTALFMHRVAFQATYLHERDLAAMTNPDRRAAIQAKVWRAQELGFVQSRVDALMYAKMLTKLTSAHWNIPLHFNQTTGAEIRQFVRMIPDGEENRGDYSLKRFKPSPRRQFTPAASEAEIREELVDSGNYPALKEENIRVPGTADEVVRWIRERRASSLVELEAYCAQQQWLRNTFGAHNIKGSLVDSLDVSSSSGVVALVERPEGSRIPRISLAIGHQSTQDHVGQGLRHVIAQRAQSGALANFQREGEDEQAAVERFLNDALLHVAGTGGSIIPSARAPKSHLLLSGAVNGMPDHFATLVLAQLADPLDTRNVKTQIVTAIYHTDAAALRSYLRKEFVGLLRSGKMGSGLNSEEIEEFLPGVNTLLQSANQARISIHEIAGEAAPRGPKFNYVGGAVRARSTSGTPPPRSKGPDQEERISAVFSLASIEHEAPTEFLLEGEGMFFNPGFASAIP